MYFPIMKLKTPRGRFLLRFEITFLGITFLGILYPSLPSILKKLICLALKNFGNIF